MTKHHQGGGDVGFHLEISAIVGIRLCLIELDVLLKYKSSSCSPTILSKPASSMRDRQMKCIYGLEGVCPPAWHYRWGQNIAFRLYSKSA